MAHWDAGLLAPGYYLRVEATENVSGIDIPGNTSPVMGRFYLQKGAGGGRFTGWHADWSLTLGPLVTSGGLAGYNFEDYDQLTLWSGTIVVEHDADGSKTIAISGGFADTDPDPELGTAVATGELELTTIPRFGKRWDGSAEVVNTEAYRWDGTQEVPLTEAYRWDGTQEVRVS